MKKHLFFIVATVFTLSFFSSSCDDSHTIIPYLNLLDNNVDILFVSETSGRQKVFGVIDTVLNDVWNVSPIGDVQTLDPTWATDGRKYAYTLVQVVSSDGFPFLSNIFVLNMDSAGTANGVIQVTKDEFTRDTLGIYHGVTNIRPDWSRDQKKIVYVSNRDTAFNIFTKNIDSDLKADSIPIKLTDKDDAIDIFCTPSFSPDGTKILYISEKSGYEEVWVMNSDGSNKTQLTTLNARITGRPRYSPDQSKIVFYSNKTSVGNDSLQVYMMNANGSGLTQITQKENNFDPAWSPDGKIIFSKQVSRKSRYIYIIDVDGTNERRLIGDNKAYYPIWLIK